MCFVALASEVVSVVVVVEDAEAMFEGQLDPDDSRARLVAAMSPISGALRVPRHSQARCEADRINGFLARSCSQCRLRSAEV